MNLFRFASPYWLIALAPLLCAALIEPFVRRRARASALFSTVSELENVKPSRAACLKRFLPCLFYVGAALLIVALARPQCGVRESRVVGNGISIAMCVDRSGSMATEDFYLNGRQVDRLRAVKQVFHDFVAGSDDFRGRPDDLIALVAFGGFVDSCCPLTLDHASLLDLLEKIQTPAQLEGRTPYANTRVAAEESGTAIGDALATSVDKLKDSTNKTKIVVFLSDGQQTAGVLSPEEGARVAKAYGVKVYTIGVGTSETVASFGGFLTRRSLDFDPATLQMIAQETGGRYYYAGDVDALKKVCEEIDQLERTRFDAGSYAEYNDWYRPFVLVGAFLIFLYAFLKRGRFRTFP